MSWTAPRTWVSGDVLTAAQLNTHVRDNLLETAPGKVTTAGDIVYATGANAIARLAATAYRMPRANSSGNALEYVASLNLAQAPIYATSGAVNLTAAQYSALGTGQAITTHGGIVIALANIQIDEAKSGASAYVHIPAISRKTSAFSSGADTSANVLTTVTEAGRMDAAASKTTTKMVIYMDTPSTTTHYYVGGARYTSASTSGTPQGACVGLILIELAP